jgi:hypothetical protein
MKTLVAAFLGVFAVPLFAAGATPSLAGKWKGTIVYSRAATLDAWASFTADKNDTWKGSFSVPGDGATEAQVRNVSIVGRQVAFEVEMPHGRLLFRGELSADGDRLQGTGIDPRRESVIALDRVGADEAPTGSGKSDDPDRALFSGLERSWRESVANRDAKALEAILSPEFEVVAVVEGRGFEATPRGPVLEAAKEGTSLAPCADGWMHVRRHGDIAVVSTLCPVAMFTDVWRRDGRKWQAVSRSVAGLAPKG